MAGARVGSWRYSDPAHLLFGKACDASLLGDAARFRPVGATALLIETEAAEVEDSKATTLERVLEVDVTSWLEHKRIGAGRDARLTSFSTASAGPTVLFHQVVATCDKNYKLSFKIFGESPAALPEVIDGMLASGMEPHTFAASYIAAFGLSKQSALAVEVQNIVHALFFYCCVDKLNPS